MCDVCPRLNSRRPAKFAPKLGRLVFALPMIFAVGGRDAASSARQALPTLKSLSKDVEHEAEAALIDNDLLASFRAAANSTAEQLQEVADGLESAQLTDQQQEELEAEFLKEFTQKLEQRKQGSASSIDGASDTTRIQKMELFAAIQDAKEALGDDVEESPVFESIRDLLSDHHKQKK